MAGLRIDLVMPNQIPHQKVVIWFSVLGVLGYAAFSVWTFAWLKDATMVGDVIGTWKSFAVLAFGFWLGSSSGGKAILNGPTDVKVVNKDDDPVKTESQDGK